MGNFSTERNILDCDRIESRYNTTYPVRLYSIKADFHASLFFCSQFEFVIETGSLRIVRVQTFHAGIYRCRATGIVGRCVYYSDNATVTVIGMYMYRRHCLLSACASNCGQQESMCLNKNMRLIKRTYVRYRRGKHNGVNCDRESAKCTYDGRKLYEERVFELSLFQ